MQKHCVLAISGLILLPAVTAGAQSLDQSYVPPGTPSLTFQMYNSNSWAGFSAAAQTFTVGQAGILSRIDVDVSRLRGQPTADADLNLHVLRTTNGRPDFDASAVLASANIPGSSIVSVGSIAEGQDKSRFVPVDLSAANLVVQPGQVLAIALDVDSPAQSNYLWMGTSVPLLSNRPYPGGHTFSQYLPQESIVGPFSRPWAQSDGNGDQEALGFKTYVTVPEPSFVAVAAAGLLFLQRRSGKHPR